MFGWTKSLIRLDDLETSHVLVTGFKNRFIAVVVYTSSVLQVKIVLVPKGDGRRPTSMEEGPMPTKRYHAAVYVVTIYSNRNYYARNTHILVTNKLTMCRGTATNEHHAAARDTSVGLDPTARRAPVVDPQSV